MSTVKKIGKNLSFLTVGNIIQKILSFIMVIYIARKLGVEDFGLYSFIFSFVAFFTVFGDLGISALVSREIAKDRSRAGEFIGDAFIIKIVLFLVVFVGIFIAGNLLNVFYESKYPLYVVFFILVAGLSLLFDSMASLFRSVFFAFQEMQYELFVNSFYKVLLVFLTLAVIFFGFGLKEIFLVAVFSSFFNFILSFFIVAKKFVRIKISFNFEKYKKLMFLSYPFSLMFIFMTIYGSADLVMLSILKGNISVGYYSAALRLTSTLAFFPTTFMSVVFPVMASFYATLNKSLNIVIERSLKYLLIFILPIAFSTTLLSGRIIELIYPSTGVDSFAPASGALIILIWFCAFNFLNLVLLNVLQSTAFEKRAFSIVGISLILNIILNLIFIPLFDFQGAAFASVLSEIVIFILGIYFVSKYFFRLSFFPKILIKCLIASFAIFVFIYLFFFLNIFVLFIVSVLLYFFILFLIKVFDKKDVSFIKKIFHREDKKTTVFI